MTTAAEKQQSKRGSSAPSRRTKHLSTNPTEASRGFYSVILEFMEKGILNSSDVREMSEKGVPVEEFCAFARRLGVPEGVLSEAIGMTPSTLTRRKHEGRLTPEESDRLASAAKILHLAIKLFGEQEKVAAEWMLKPCHGLEGDTPLSCARLSIKKDQAVNLLEGAIHGEFYS